LKIVDKSDFENLTSEETIIKDLNTEENESDDYDSN